MRLAALTFTFAAVLLFSGAAPVWAVSPKEEAAKYLSGNCLGIFLNIAQRWQNAGGDLWYPKEAMAIGVCGDHMWCQSVSGRDLPWPKDQNPQWEDLEEISISLCNEFGDSIASPCQIFSRWGDIVYQPLSESKTCDPTSLFEDSSTIARSGEAERLLIAESVSSVEQALAAAVKARAARDAAHNLPSSRRQEHRFKEGRWIGEMRDSVPHGHGSWVWYHTDGERIYEGQTEKGYSHGYGVGEIPTGDIYEGEFRLGAQKGHGVHYFPDGGKHIGEWHGGYCDGQGVRYFPDGRIWAGLWSCKGKGFVSRAFLSGNKYSSDDAPPTLLQAILSPSERSNAVSKEQSSSPSPIPEEHPSTSQVVNSTSMDKAKIECEELGFTLKTEKFGDCVLRLMEYHAATEP